MSKLCKFFLQITTYLGKRDFLDRGTFVDPIDGMVLIDEEYIKQGRKVIVQLNAAFRYGREDLDVLGLTFRKDLIKQSFQVCPTQIKFSFMENNATLGLSSGPNIGKAVDETARKIEKKTWR